MVLLGITVFVFVFFRRKLWIQPPATLHLAEYIFLFSFKNSTGEPFFVHVVSPTEVSKNTYNFVLLTRINLM